MSKSSDIHLDKATATGGLVSGEMESAHTSASEGGTLQRRRVASAKETGFTVRVRRWKEVRLCENRFFSWRRTWRNSALFWHTRARAPWRCMYACHWSAQKRKFSSIYITLHRWRSGFTSPCKCSTWVAMLCNHHPQFLHWLWCEVIGNMTLWSI